MADYVPPRSCCFVCRASTDLFACAGCSAIEYCSKDHESQDSTRHAKECKGVREGRLEFQEIHKLIKDTYNVTDGDLPALFDGANSVLFRQPLADKYITASRLFSRALFAIDSALAVQLVYDHLLWMHLIGHEQNDPGSDLAGALLLQGKDQLCFRYIEFADKIDYERSMYDPPVQARVALLAGFPEGPEIVEILRAPVDGAFQPGMWDVLTLMLVEFWWLRDLEALETLRNCENWLAQKLNWDIVHMITKAIPQTGFVREERLYRDDNKDLIRILRARLYYLFLMLHRDYKDVWPTLLEAIKNGRMIHAEDMGYGPMEVMGNLQICQRAWRDTPGAFDYVQEMLPKADSLMKRVEASDADLTWERQNELFIERTDRIAEAVKSVNVAIQLAGRHDVPNE